MKIVVLGDIHGRTIWKDIIAKEQPDQVIFLGDYVSTHYYIDAQTQIDNFKDILAFKASHPNTIMLRGNHDLQHLDYPWASCSGYDRKVAEMFVPLKEEYLKNTQWLYKIDHTVFSHAGITKDWLHKHELAFDQVNMLGPSYIFGFDRSDRWDIYGTSPTQPPTWVRPGTLIEHMIPDHDQVVGHTTVHKCYNVKELEHSLIPYNLWLCDALENKSYLVITNGIYEEHSL